MKVEGSGPCYLLESSKERDANSEEVVGSEDETIFNPLDMPFTGEFRADANGRAWDEALYDRKRTLTRSPRFSFACSSSRETESSGGNRTRYDKKTEF